MFWRTRSVSILFQNHPQRYEKLICIFIRTLLPPTKILWLERDLNLHLQVSRPPLYPLSYQVKGKEILFQVMIDHTHYYVPLALSRMLSRNYHAMKLEIPSILAKVAGLSISKMLWHLWNVIIGAVYLLRYIKLIYVARQSDFHTLFKHYQKNSKWKRSLRLMRHPWCA